MKKNQPPLSIKLIYWVTNIGYWLFTAVAVVVLIMIIGVSMNLIDNDLNLKVGLPVSFDVKEQGTLQFNETPTLVTLTEAYGKVGFREIPRALLNTYTALILLVFGVTFYLIHTFKMFIKNIYSGIYFKIANIKLLKRLSYGLGIFWMIIVVYSVLQMGLLAVNMQFDTIEIVNRLDFQPGVLITALLIWVLSHVFMHGLKLQEEQSLTI